MTGLEPQEVQHVLQPPRMSRRGSRSSIRGRFSRLGARGGDEGSEEDPEVGFPQTVQHALALDLGGGEWE
jgi:hypothetical protein